MTKHNIHIERLQIRMRGISPETARAITGDLGQEILNQLTYGPRNHGTRHIAGVDAGTAQVNSATKPADLRTQLAKQVAGSIKSAKK